LTAFRQVFFTCLRSHSGG